MSYKVMAVCKSHVEEYLELYACLIKDVEAFTGFNLWRDYEEIRNRTNSEGISFLTKTLPRFYKELLVGVECGVFQQIAGFKLHRRSGPLPAFLRALVSRLFSEDGKLLDDSDPSFDPYCLGYIAQLCTFMYKVEFPYDEVVTERYIAKFKEIDQSLIENFRGITPGSHADLTLNNAMLLLQELFKEFELTELPRQGPGAVAGREVGYRKYEFPFEDSIDDVFTFEEYLYPCESLYMGEGSQERRGIATYCETGEDTRINSILQGIDASKTYARVVLVPKDSRGPRIISCEPTSHQFLQQMVGRSLMRHLEVHPLTRGHVNFTDQSVNSELALSSSVTRKLATLDMEDASDRVSLALVRLLMPKRVFRYLEGSRSTGTILPNGEEILLRKFAPMGSACCFPVESVIFWALSVGSIAARTGWDYMKASRHVFVYGDDIIVTSSFAGDLIAVFPEFSLKFNARKSFIRGPFRESCGCDAISGIDVTAIKLRQPVPESCRCASSIVSWLETSNLLHKAGYWATAQYLGNYLEELLGYGFPVVPENAGCLGVFSYSARGYALTHDDTHVVGRTRAKRLYKPFRIQWDYDLQCVSLRGLVTHDPEFTDHEHTLQSLLAALAKDCKEGVSLDIATRKPHAFSTRKGVSLRTRKVIPR